MNKIILLIFILFFEVISLPATNLIFQHITTDNGLQHNSVFSIIQDKKGFLWFATENGLHRYDGIEFKIFYHDPNDSNSIASNVVYKILPDPEGTFWLCTYSGFDYYNDQTENFIHIPIEKIENKRVTFIKQFYCPSAVIDKKGQVYVSYGNVGIYVLDKKENRLKKLISEHIQPQNIHLGNIINMFVTGNNILWLGSQSRGLYSYNISTGEIHSYNNDLKFGNKPSNNIFSIAEDRWGRLFVATSEGIFYKSEASNNFIKYKPYNDNYSLAYHKVWQIASDKKGDLWFCTNGGGIGKLLNKELNFINYQHNEFDTRSLNDNFIQCFFEDNQGNYWIGTQRGGINYVVNNNSQVFNVINNENKNEYTLSDYSVSAIAEDKDGYVWIGTDGGGINLLNPQNKTIRYFYRGTLCNTLPAKESILTIFIDHENNIWAGGYLSGLIRIYQDRRRSKVYYSTDNKSGGLEHDDIRWIMEDSYNRMWVATNGGGVYLYNRIFDTFKAFKAEDKENPICSNYTLVLQEDSLKNLWVGTYNGISKIDLKTFKVTNFGTRDGLNSKWVYSLLFDSKKNLWVGTNTGIYQFNYTTQKFIDITNRIKLPNFVVSGLLEDNNGNIWISTYYGLVRYNPLNNSTNIYYKTDGLPGNNFNHGAYYKNSKGLLYFGSTNGLVFFNPDLIKTNTTIPPIYITGIKNSLSNEVPIHSFGFKKIILHYNEASVFTITYASLNYINPEKNQYAIRLEGIDKEWRLVGNQKKTTYTNIPPGKYIFRVKGSNNDNIWNESGDQLIIEILPPFWKTNIAYVIYFLLSVSLIIFIWYQTLLRVKYKKDLEIEHLKAQKAEEMARMKTEFFINVSHELSTPLTLILTPIERLVKLKKFNERLIDIVYRNAKLLLRLINELLEYQRIEENKEKLNLTQGEIVFFIRQVVQNFTELAKEKNITLIFESTISLLWIKFDQEKLEKILYNLISNAIKYTPNGGSVNVKVKSANNDIYILVQDTGIGISKEDQQRIFERYYRSTVDHVENLSRATGFGIGLYLTKQLVELHRGQLMVDSDTGKGTTFTVVLPIIPTEKDIIDNTSETMLPNYDQHEPINNEEEDEIDNMNLLPRRQSILIVEDNIEVCEILEILLRKKYNLYFANDGQTGYKLAIKLMPNLIVTDIMLPQMDGIELCRKIKRDFYTSHIPVVMLTALNSNEFMIKGLSTGADDYISKPFNPDVFELRIHNILESRNILQKKFLTDIQIRPSEIVVNSVDEQFLNKLVGHIEANLMNPNFDVEKLADLMNMTTITLYRKLKAISGQSINQFIRTIRLKNAARLLENKSISVQDAAFAVGFNDLKYFRKCFQKQFGINPSEYGNLNQTE